MCSTSEAYDDGRVREPTRQRHRASKPAGLGELLVDRGRITPRQLDEALRLQAATTPWTPIGQIMVECGWISSEQLTQDLADHACKPFLRLAPEMVAKDTVSALPLDFMEKHNLLPLSATESVVVVAMERFTDVLLIDEVEQRVARDVVVIAAEAENIRATRRATIEGAGKESALATKGGQTPLSQILSQIGVDDLQVVEHQNEDDSDLETTASESPVVKLVNYIIKTAVESSASDIHIEPDEKSFRVRCRIHGDLVTALEHGGRMLPAVVSRIKLLAGMDISERRLPQDGGVTIKVFDRSVDLRVSTMTTRFGEKAVLRIVDREAGVQSLDAVGMTPRMLEQFRALTSEPNGIVLVTGPTGSGKSTTLYSALTELISADCNVSTIEDPVERVVRGANQFQVNPQAGFTFAKALRSMLRQDPDIIMVGEIRDEETARLATEAALTGHLVLSTLHTNDAPTAVPRLINMGVEKYLVAAALRGVVAQRLVKKICQRCVKPIEFTAKQRKWLRRMCGDRHGVESPFRGQGCAACSQTGIEGRIGVFELMTFDEATVAGGPGVSAPHDALTPWEAGGLVRDGLDKVRRGLIGLDSLLDIGSRIDGRAQESDDTWRTAA